MRVEGLGAASQDIERKDLRKINRSLARLPLLALAAWVEDYSCCHVQFCRAKLLKPCGILQSPKLYCIILISRECLQIKIASPLLLHLQFRSRKS